MVHLREFLNSFLSETGNDLPKAQTLASKKLAEFLDQGKIKVEDVSIKDLFEVLVDPNRKFNVTSSPQAIAEAIGPTEFPYAVGKLISKVALPAYESALGDVTDLVETVSSKRRREDIVGFEAYDEPLEVLPGMPYEEVDFTEYNVEIKNHKFGRILSIDKETVLFDQTGEILSRARKLSEKLGSHRHRFIIQKCCDLDVTATGEGAGTCFKYKGANHSIYSADHSSIDGQTNPNLTTTAFGFNGLVEAKALLKRMRDRRGNEIITTGTLFVLVPPELEHKALLFVTQDMTPYTTDRTKNIFRGTYKLIATPVLTDSNDWYYGYFPKQMRLQNVWDFAVEEQREASKEAFEKDVIHRIKISYFAGIGATDYRFVVKGSVA